MGRRWGLGLVAGLTVLAGCGGPATGAAVTVTSTVAGRTLGGTIPPTHGHTVTAAGTGVVTFPGTRVTAHSAVQGWKRGGLGVIVTAVDPDARSSWGVR